MTRHVVMMRFAERATDQELEAIADGVRALDGEVSGLRSISCGFDLGLADGNAAFVVVADFDDDAGYLAYTSHPAHVRLLTERIRPVLVERTAVQYRVED